MQKLVVFALFILLSACAQKPVTDYDTSRDFNTLQHYAWIDTPLTTDSDPIINNSLNKQRIQQSANDILMSRGHKLVAHDQADFLITYRLVTRDKVVPSSTGIGMGLGFFGGSSGIGLGGNVATAQYPETELFIDMLDPKTSALIWRGSVRCYTQTTFTPDARDDDIRNKVGLILAAFPPQ